MIYFFSLNSMLLKLNSPTLFNIILYRLEKNISYVSRIRRATVTLTHTTAVAKSPEQHLGATNVIVIWLRLKNAPA